MIIDLRGMKALQQLRIDLQESAGLEFPDACRNEMLLLYDVCKYLELNLFQAQEILGAAAFQMVTTHINAPVGVPTEGAYKLVNASL